MRDEGKLIASIYEAAVEPTTWPDALGHIGEALGHASLALITAEHFDKPINAWLARYDPACMEIRFRHYARPETNPLVRAATVVEPLTVVPRKRIISAREFERDPAVQSILISQGLYHGCIATLYRARPLLSILEVHPPRQAGDFDRSEIRFLQRLVPHMAHALRVYRHVSASEIHQHRAEEALNQLDVGLLLLAGDGRLVFGNRAAQEILRRADGIRAREGKLAATQNTDNVRFAGAIAEAAGHTARPRLVQALHIDRGAARRPLQVWTVPFPRESRNVPVRARPSDVMVSLIDPERTLAPPVEALRALYGLTEAEARLTCGLLKGERLENYAKRAGISINTARTHLKSVFAKTDTDRQIELMRLFLRTPCGSE